MFWTCRVGIFGTRMRAKGTCFLLFKRPSKKSLLVLRNVEVNVEVNVKNAGINVKTSLATQINGHLAHHGIETLRVLAAGKMRGGVGVLDSSKRETENVMTF